MALKLRPAAAADASAAGDICYRAFKTLAEKHGFAPDFPSGEVAAGMLGALIGHDGFFSLIAEADGLVVGSNFMDERGVIASIGPVTVEPALQNGRVGQALMQAALDRARERGFAGIRLLQAGYHSRSLALYLKLGFEARDHVSCLQGPAIGKAMPGYAVRAAMPADLAACDRLCMRIHGHDRSGELRDAISQGAARLVERAGRVTGYATPIAYFGHAVGETNDDVKALIGAAPSYPGPGFLVPTRNSDIMRWCLAEGLRVTQTATLMTIGLYNQPEGAWLPSILF